MKTTNNTNNICLTTKEQISNGLTNVKTATVSTIDKKTVDTAKFLDEKINSFNVDLSNKTATTTLTSFATCLDFNDSIKLDSTELYNGVSDDVSNYLNEVINIARKNMNKACKPILDKTAQIRAGIINHDNTVVAENCKALLGVTLTTEQVNSLSDMLITANRNGLKVMSENMFNNLFCHIMLARLKKSGSYSTKRINGALNSAIKSVPTISYDEAVELSSSTVEYCVKALGYSKRFEGDKYDYAKMKEIVIKALHSRIAVRPKDFEEVKEVQEEVKEVQEEVKDTKAD